MYLASGRTNPRHTNDSVQRIATVFTIRRLGQTYSNIFVRRLQCVHNLLTATKFL